MQQLISVLLFTLLTTLSYSQRSFEIRDEVLNKSVPFVKVFPDKGDPFLTDLDGRIIIGDSVSQFYLRSYDYADTLILVSQIQGAIIYLSTPSQEIEGVVVVAGENRAHRIMGQVIDNRKKNHPLANDAFTCKSYSKFKFDVNPDGIAAIPDSSRDSTLLKLKEYMGAQHLFLMESASKRSFIPPYRDIEEILAYKVSGFNDPMFSTFANSFQSFSFYENQFDILGKQYINPIARGGIRRYFFILEDTTMVGVDTTFTISFRPRAGKNFEGMKGQLFINSNGYAIEKVIAEPYDDSSGIQMRIVQEYEFLQDTKWFPVKLSTDIDLKNFQASGTFSDLYVQGRGTSYIEDIQLNPEIKKRLFNNNVTIATADGAGELAENEWDSLRRFDITEKELKTYETVDSLSKELNFDRFLTIAKILSDGKLPIGKYFNLDLRRIFSYNHFERYRFGAGIVTSEKLIKPIQFGGYFGWATGDKRWKYGGHATIHMHRRRGIKLDLSYQQDNLERGGFSFHENQSFISTDSYRYLFISQMDEQRLGEAALSWDVKSNIELKFLGNYQRIWYSDDYEYLPSNLRKMDLAETGVELTWNILEKSMMLGSRKVSLGRKYPQIKLKAIHGWKGWFDSEYDYTRINAQISQVVPVRGVGKFTWKVAASKLIGDAPLILAYNGDGTGKDWLISTPNTFEAMLPGSFYTTSQVSLFTRFDFKAFATKASWNEPRIALHHALGFGEFHNRANHQLVFETMDNGYYEAGLILDGLLTSSFTSIGLAGFYKYGPYSSNEWTQNIVPKIVATFRID